MNFDRQITADCIIPPVPVPDPRCLDAAFNLANPDICANQGALIIKPSVAFLCQLESVDFRVFEYRDGVETELLIGVRFTSSDGNVFAVGVNTGSGTGLVAGDAIVTVTYGDQVSHATVAVLPGENCCDEISVVSGVVVDNSRSFSLSFGGVYSSRLAFGKEAAKKYVSNQILVDDIPKDSLKVWKFSETLEALTALSSDESVLDAAIDGIGQTQNKTNLLQVFEDVSSELIDTESDRRVLVVVSDGEQTANTDKQAILDAATVFKATGGIIIIVGVRASGNGFDLLERLATPGFFLNATSSNSEEILGTLLYLKSILCAGKCVPVGDIYVNQPALDYSSFLDWEVLVGQVNLLGSGLLDLLPGNGLYVEMAGGSPATLRTISTFDLVAGQSYSISFRAAGNQREFVAGQSLKVYLREVGANDSDPNVFEHTVSPSWDNDFNTFTFGFTAIGNQSVRIYFEQIGGTDKGNLLDDVVFTNTTDQTVLLSDNFDGENLTYVPPACGSSTGLSGIDDPDAPVVEQIANTGDDAPATYKYSYGYSWRTNEGETAITPVEFVPLENEKSGATRKVTLAAAPERAVSIVIWRSLGELAAITVFGAGDASANGQYVNDGSGFYTAANGYTIRLNGGIYELWDASETVTKVRYSNSSGDLFGLWDTLENGPGPLPTVTDTVAASATETSMFLLAELPISEIVYLDSESRAAFEARYESSVTAPDINTTGVASGSLGYGYDCNLYECGDSPGLMVSDASPLPDVENGNSNPPSVFNSTQTVCATCPAGFIDLGSFSLYVATGGSLNLFDATGDLFSAHGGSLPAWAQLNLSLPPSNLGPTTVNYYEVKAWYVSASPKSFQLLGSNDGATWATVDSRTDQAWYFEQTKRFIISTPTEYTYWRLNVTELNPELPGDTSLPNLRTFKIYLESEPPCSTASATGGSPSEAIANAKAAALLLAQAQLNCIAIYTATISYTAHCPAGTLGSDVVRSATRTSLISQEDANNLAQAAAQTEAEAALVCTGSNNTSRIVINDRTGANGAKASPYPAVKFVEDVVGIITKVTVSLLGFKHASPDDVHIVLVSPSGTAVTLLANAGGVPPVPGVTTPIDIVFDDAAGSALPDNAQLTAGSWRVSRYGSEGAGFYPSPFPTPANSLVGNFWGANLAAFNGENPNGGWALYIIDDLATFGGEIVNGFELAITVA